MIFALYDVVAMNGGARTLARLLGAACRRLELAPLDDV